MGNPAEALIVEQALATVRQMQETAAAAALGMKPSTLRDEISKHGLG